MALSIVIWNKECAIFMGDLPESRRGLLGKRKPPQRIFPLANHAVLAVCPEEGDDERALEKPWKEFAKKGVSAADSVSRTAELLRLFIDKRRLSFKGSFLLAAYPTANSEKPVIARFTADGEERAELPVTAPGAAWTGDGRWMKKKLSGFLADGATAKNRYYIEFDPRVKNLNSLTAGELTQYAWDLLVKARAEHEKRGLTPLGPKNTGLVLLRDRYIDLLEK